MSDWKTRAKALMAELEQERDELRLKMHLAKADAKDELARLEKQLDRKMSELKAKLASLDKDGDGSVTDDLSDAARDLAREIRAGFQKLRERI